jgi:hypothetical protein
MTILIHDNHLWQLHEEDCQLAMLGGGSKSTHTFPSMDLLWNFLRCHGYDDCHKLTHEEMRDNECFVIGLDNDHCLIYANTKTNEVWNSGEHFTEEPRSLTASEEKRVALCLSRNPFFDFHTCTDSEDGQAVLIFNTETDGTQDTQICAVPVYNRSGDRQEGWDELVRAEKLGEFVLEAIRFYMKYPSGREAWAALLPHLRPPAKATS